MKKITLNFLFLIISLGGFSAAARAQAAGDLDPGFGTGGRVTVNLMPSTSTGNGGLKAFVEPSGKTYQFGSLATAQTTSIAGIVRLTEQGLLDTSFDGDGTVVVNFPEFSFSRFYSGALQPDGKLLAVGSATRNNLPYSLLARFHPDGRLDTGFGTGGYVLFRNPGAIQINFYWSNAFVEPDGKIVVAGALDYQMAAARFTADGQLDTGFGTGGYRLVQVSLLGELWDMKLTPGGRIVLVGKAETNFNDGNHSDYVLLQLTNDGQLDENFAAGGIRRFDLTPETLSDTEIIQSVQLLPDGKILCFGRTGDFVSINAVVMRFNANGSFDQSFGENGVKIIDYNNQNNVGVDMAVQTDGKIVLVETDGFNNYLVQRLLPDGTFDATFGSGGSVVVDMGGRDRPYSISLWGDKIVVAGHCLGQNGVIRHFGVARLLQSSAAPTAALRGRAVNLLNRGIAGAQIALLNTVSGEVLETVADSAGNFEFLLLPRDRQYVLTPRARRCYFLPAQVTINLTGSDVTALLKANCFKSIK